ncbi:hypothetical protein [Nonomuraea dietziae]|uniref:hypothetical protein n=1 Tax=Nonomuraea dietziae TaxID=65515 RepID=UPI0033F80850
MLRPRLDEPEPDLAKVELRRVLLMIQDRVRLRGLFTDLERQWATGIPTDPLSPDRIDASVLLAYGPSPEANQRAGLQHGPAPRRSPPSTPHRPQSPL